MPDRGRSALASESLTGHLRRGAIGFGLIVSAFAATSFLGPAALLLAPAGLLVLRGCPACWVIGLAETVSAGRLERNCREAGCTPRRPSLEDHARRSVAPLLLDNHEPTEER
jgi:hypothetical protein